MKVMNCAGSDVEGFLLVYCTYEINNVFVFKTMGNTTVIEIKWD